VALFRLANIVRSNAGVLFITGAGLSAASGIATFRGSPSAVCSERAEMWNFGAM
jgi:NAD-dependent SIR2 family protein deacetylase